MAGAGLTRLAGVAARPRGFGFGLPHSGLHPAAHMLIGRVMTSESRAKVDSVCRVLQESFPLPGYVAIDTNDIYRDLAELRYTHLDPPAHVFDFGSGALDKATLIALSGLHCVAYDDYNDPWHQDARTLGILKAFAASNGVQIEDSFQRARSHGPFDLVMSNHVLEHLHDSPRRLLMDLVKALVPGGLLLITVPNAVNLRKRVDVLRGRTNHPDYEQYFRYPPPWRGHVREYVKADLSIMSQLLGLEVVELRSTHHMLARLPRRFHKSYRRLTKAAPGLRDSWWLLARKPQNWSEELVKAESVGKAAPMDH